MDDRVAIVGGGAAGALLALQLAARGIASVILDRAGNYARGVAYGAGRSWHRLNVPIEKMGGWGADENARDFQHWYEARHGGFGTSLAERYVPRQDYGDWLHDVLQDAAATGRVVLRTAEVVALAPADRHVRVHLADGTSLAVPAAVLCLGNHPPRALGPAGARRVIEDMWAPGAMDAIDPGEPVLIVGTGATGIDALLELHHRAHQGPITMLSRRGLMPLVDAEPAPYVLTQPIVEGRPPLSRLIRRLRLEAARAVESGRTWQSMIDAVRGELTGLWPHLSLTEQRRFVRHLRAYWLVHRHRLAPDIAVLIDKLTREGRLKVLQGRLAAVDARQDRVCADVALRSGARARLEAGRLINCTGPADDVRRLEMPLLRALLATGAARPSPLGIGLDVDGDARLLAADGTPQARVFVLGTATWPRFGEVTSAPQIRRRASVLTDVLAQVLSSMERAT